MIEEYIRFSYFNEMQITQQNVEDLLEFASFLNSYEMLALVEKFLCDLTETLPNNFELLKEYFQVAEHYMLEQFKQKLGARITGNTALVVV